MGPHRHSPGRWEEPMWSEWLARTLKPQPARKSARPAEVVAEERRPEPDVPSVPEECALRPHEPALVRAAAARGSL